MNYLKFYHLDNNYIDYLRKKEVQKRGFSKVPYNTNIHYLNKKVYVGIVLSVGDYKYFVPLTHPKEHYEESSKFFNRISYSLKLKNGRNYGRLMFCYMLPLKDESVAYPIDINRLNDEGYRNVLMTQYFFINSKNERDKIKNKAKSLYDKVHHHPEHYLYRYCCDFELLENACNQYANVNSSSSQIVTICT